MTHANMGRCVSIMCRSRHNGEIEQMSPEATEREMGDGLSRGASSGAIHCWTQTDSSKNAGRTGSQATTSGASILNISTYIIFF